MAGFTVVGFQSGQGRGTEGRRGEGTLGLRQDHSGDPVCGRPSISHRIYVYMYSFILYIFLNIYI